LYRIHSRGKKIIYKVIKLFDEKKGVTIPLQKSSERVAKAVQKSVKTITISVKTVRKHPKVQKKF
jgi:hypothetical protein